MQIEKEKTRSLSPAEYFIVVQSEFIQAEFRKKIYYSVKDKNYYEKVMGYKRETIEKISKRNNLKSIFNCKEKMSDIRKRCFRDGNGFPLFIMSDSDIFNYFMPNNEFSYNGDIFMLKEVNHAKKLATIDDNGKSMVVSFKDIVRIL